MAKYIDYEFTPEVYHPATDTDGKDKSFRAPARLVFIADDGSKRHCIPGSPEAESLFAEVSRNNPSIIRTPIEGKKMRAIGDADDEDDGPEAKGNQVQEG